MYARALESHAKTLNRCPADCDPAPPELLNSTTPLITIIRKQQLQIDTAMKAALKQITNMSQGISDDEPFKLPEGKCPLGKTPENIDSVVKGLRSSLGYVGEVYKHLEKLVDNIIIKTTVEWTCKSDDKQKATFYSRYYECAWALEYQAKAETLLKEPCKKEFRTWAHQQAGRALRSYGLAMQSCPAVDQKIKFTRDENSAMFKQESELKAEIPKIADAQRQAVDKVTEREMND